MDSFARENVKEYKSLNAPNQSMIRRLIREGRAKGLSDSDVAMFARVSAHSGIDIQFDNSADFVRKTKSGKEITVDGFYEADKNRIVVNPNGKRTAERLLIHELDHAITKDSGKNRKKVLDMYKTAIKNTEAEKRNDIIEAYGDDLFTTFDETNAYYAEQVLGNKYTLEKLLEAEPTLKDKILSFFKGASTDYADVPKLSGAAKKYYRTYKKLFDEFSARNVESNAMSTEKNNYFSNETGNVNYAFKIGKSLAENVDSVLSMSDDEARKNKTEGNFVSVMQNTPDIVLNNVKGAENLEIIMRFDSFYLATRQSGTLEGHYHNYGPIMKNLPEILSTPLAIVKMDNGRLNLLSSVETSKGKYSIVSVELNTIKDINSKNEKYNMVISVIPSNDNYMKNNLNKHGISVEYVKEDLPQVNHQLYEWLATVNERSSKSSIPQTEGKSNSFDKNSSDKDFALDLDSEGENISGAEVKPKAKAQPKAKTKAQVRADQVVQNKKIRAEADYTTDKVFSQASVKRNFDKVEAVKKIPASVREDIARRLWIELEMSEGDEIRDSIALGYSVELFQAIRFADFERIRIKSSKTP